MVRMLLVVSLAKTVQVQVDDSDSESDILTAVRPGERRCILLVVVPRY